jgi:hypothetical protein
MEAVQVARIARADRIQRYRVTVANTAFAASRKAAADACADLIKLLPAAQHCRRAIAPARRGDRVYRTPHLEAGCVRDCSCGKAGRNVAPARQDEAAPSMCGCESRSCPCWPRANSALGGDLKKKKKI